ncbi:phosphatase PAP2 family protein [Gallaecimonas xiamenensis]|uniref:undecaprenyl-diphosphate phosphatase n=1 Tax=Gallaecimonas xiamenensis 3-C-1 TaxID=745411 RepID=K2JR88_9GAMM|nr:phosphatase PAP2 family protein [Gallaecimonas xiamenensis]EKE77037.1 phosphoesterase, PA-phosphatase-like protein [Gallaecimonas xiamenensis 3-C-1]
MRNLTALDHRLFQKSQSHPQWRQMAGIARWVSRTGDGPLYGLIALAFWMSQWPALQGYVLDLLAAFAIELPLYIALKNTFRRRRPAVALPGAQAFIKPSDQFSLPSGHTAAAFVMVTMAIGHFGLSGLLALPWAMLVGLARVLLGVHFPSDILAGAALGACCACLILF